MADDTIDLLLPNGGRMACSLPLHPQLKRQLDTGHLRVAAELDGPADTPAAEPDGEGGAERGSAPPPADPADSQPPAGNASQAEWAEYAISQGMDRAEAESLKREEIKARIAPADPTDPEDGE